MRKIIIPIPDFSHTEKTYLDADYSTGTALTVENNYGFADNDIAIIGQPGEEKTESKDVASQTGNTTINISGALKFSHNKSAIVYRYEYDQYEIYRYRSGSWTLISTSNIQWDKLETIYIDTSGLSTDSYKFRLLNSVSSAVSDYSPSVAATGFTSSQVGYMIDQVRKILGDQERKIVTDDEIIRQFNRVQDIVKAIRPNWWFLRKENSSITTIVNIRKYGLLTYLSDLNYIDTVRYKYLSGAVNNTYQLGKRSLVEMDYLTRDGNATGDDWPSCYTIEPPDSVDTVGYITIDKPPLTTGLGTFYIRYFKNMTNLSTVSDATDIPIPSILEDFAIAYGFRVKGDETKANIYEQRFWGPQVGHNTSIVEKSREVTGLRLLEVMQNSKGKAIGQPESLKKWRGRRAIKTMFQSSSLNRDELHEKFY